MPLPPPVHLDDLAVPRFQPPDRPDPANLWRRWRQNARLDADALHAKATAETGLADFGPDDYRERLEVYLAALREIDGLHGPGIVNFHAQVLQSLKNRLLLTDLLARHPEIRDIELLPPVVIAGLPRTGTPICTPAGGGPDVPHYPVLGERRAVSAARRAGG